MWGGKTIKNSHLEIPHPRLHLRNFALIPLMEIASDKIHPLFKKTIEELYDESQDPLDVFIIDED
jgi:2-amino-4-hydroxy-6-hydroxymethyldihydropteridine diphosphokinase